MENWLFIHFYPIFPDICHFLQLCNITQFSTIISSVSGAGWISPPPAPLRAPLGKMMLINGQRFSMAKFHLIFQRFKFSMRPKRFQADNFNKRNIQDSNDPALIHISYRSNNILTCSVLPTTSFLLSRPWIHSFLFLRILKNLHFQKDL